MEKRDERLPEVFPIGAVTVCAELFFLYHLDRQRFFRYISAVLDTNCPVWV
jgi:hypothetical protein